MKKTALAGLLLVLVAPPLAAQQVFDWSRFRELVDRGRYEEAERRLQDRPEALAQRWELELLERRGARPEALRKARQLLAGLQLGPASTEDLAQAAFAAWRLDRWEESNQIFIEAAERPDASPSLYVDWGNLYLQQYNAAEAADIFKDALKIDWTPGPADRWSEADIYLGLARALGSQGNPEAEAALKKAEELAPDNLDLLAYQALRELRESDWDAARKHLERGLGRNRNYLPLLHLQAAWHFFRDEGKEFEKLQGRVLEINPGDADFYELLGDLCVLRRRLDQAISFFRTALRNDPSQWSALASLGINLLRVGEEEEGKSVLEQAYENDPYNIWTVNTLRLLDSFDRFTRFSTPHFQVKIEKDEVGALRPYVEPLLERSLSTIAEKYQHPIEGPQVFEMYGDHEDFAVRTLGLPGLGALGATFGKVVAMDSPSARPGGRFHWGATLWHEIAHVVTLSLSNQRVPRWLTEGISMLEEKLSHPGWGDPLSIPFVRAYAEDKLLSIPELNSGFERPRFPGQLELSYFQAGWICDFIAQRYGVEKLREMLLAFAENQKQEEVVKRVLGLSEQELDEQFKAEMKALLDPLVQRLEPLKTPDFPDGKLQLAAHFNLAEENPDNYFANFHLGRRLLEEERVEEAIPYLEKAIRLFPEATGDSSPYPLLAGIYRKQGDQERLLGLLQGWWELAPRYADLGLELAQQLIEQGRSQEAIPVLEGLMFVDPLQGLPHQLLGELYLEQHQPARAVGEFRVALSLQPADPAGAHFRLASALAAQGDADAARREVLLALEIAPSYPEAQRLLLELVRR